MTPLADPVHFVDANVPMYAVGTEHPLKSPCLAILDAIARGRLNAVTDAEVFQEILHRYTALGQRARAVEVCELFAQVVTEVWPVTMPVMQRAFALHERYPTIQARDAVHAAAMVEHGLTHIVSADRHFDEIEALIRIDPADFERNRA